LIDKNNCIFRGESGIFYRVKTMMVLKNIVLVL